MRNYRFVATVAAAAVIALGGPPAVIAQTKPPSASPKAPASYDPRDFSGVWFDDRPRPVLVNERYWIFKFNAEEPPMTAWGEAQYKAAKSSFGEKAYPLAETNDPLYHNCTPPGLPRIYLHPFPMQIVQTPGEVILLFEYDSMRHPIFTDGRKHDETLGPLWMGDSIGHWEGDTLVTDTVNFNEKTWVDRMGHPHSDQLHVIEHIRRVDHDHLEDDITVDDPKAYTKPWTGHMTYALYPKWTLGEYFCEDQSDFDEIENNETKPMK
jgi:hypothetical protein